MPCRVLCCLPIKSQGCSKCEWVKEVLNSHLYLSLQWCMRRHISAFAISTMVENVFESNDCILYNLYQYSCYKCVFLSFYRTQSWRQQQNFEQNCQEICICNYHFDLSAIWTLHFAISKLSATIMYSPNIASKILNRNLSKSQSFSSISSKFAVMSWNEKHGARGWHRLLRAHHSRVLICHEPSFILVGTWTSQIVGILLTGFDEYSVCRPLIDGASLKDVVYAHWCELSWRDISVLFFQIQSRIKEPWLNHNQCVANRGPHIRKWLCFIMIILRTRFSTIHHLKGCQNLVNIPCIFPISWL